MVIRAKGLDAFPQPFADGFRIDFTINLTGDSADLSSRPVGIARGSSRCTIWRRGTYPPSRI